MASRAKERAKQRAEESAKKDELLGPEFPDMPMRKCHEKGCNEMTTQYRCDRCRAKYRAKSYASGLSGMSDLFRGGYISPVASSGYAS